MKQNNIRKTNERKRNFDKELSLFNPLYLQFYFLVNEIKDYFENLPSEKLKIIDFGCGSKPYDIFTTNKDYIGIDIDEANVKADIHCNIENIPLENEIADVVVSFMVLEHVENPLKVLQEKFRILKNNGELFMTVPLYWEEHEQPYDFYRFTRFGIKSLLQRCGFQEIVIKEMNTNYAILGMHLARLFSSRRLLSIFVPLINFIFLKLEKKVLKKAKANNKEISNVMTFSVKAKKVIL